MKVRIKSVNDIVNDEIKKQLNDFRSDIYDEISEDVVKQTIACCLCVLDKSYGFRKKRLESMVRSIADMLNIQPFGKSIRTDDCIKYLKEQYNIDLDEIKIITEKK